MEKTGTKAELASEIAQITRVSTSVLEDPTQLQKASIAKRMSWASDRVTTREEDIAYSLMRIFEIDLTLLYGEGKKAFGRLQEEIMKGSTDQSLLAWAPPLIEGFSKATSLSFDLGLLARHPRDFSQSSNIVAYQSIRHIQ